MPKYYIWNASATENVSLYIFSRFSSFPCEEILVDKSINSKVMDIVWNISQKKMTFKWI